MDEEIRDKCEVLACSKPQPSEAGKKKAAKSAEVCLILWLQSAWVQLFLVTSCSL